MFGYFSLEHSTLANRDVNHMLDRRINVLLSDGSENIFVLFIKMLFHKFVYIVFFIISLRFRLQSVQLKQKNIFCILQGRKLWLEFLTRNCCSVSCFLGLLY